MVPGRITVTTACAAAHLPLTILLLEDSCDEPTPIPGSSTEADVVQLVAWAATLLDELHSVRIRIFPSGSTY
ncbi:MAG: hypothetical protein M3256_21680 [Actinomycetota bacterium]|nr:hypothetical protein [Actinomycetota bacterium]